MFVKICANTNLEDARLAAEMGADALGFVFAPSKRRVTPEQVAAITRGFPADRLAIGVFQSQDAAEILDAVERTGIGAVQLHSRYNPELIDRLHAATQGKVLLIQVLPVEILPGEDEAERTVTGSTTSREALLTPLSNPKLWAVLLDAAHAGASGGLGRTFDWRALAPVLADARRAAELRHKDAGTRMPLVLLAGGLRPENVREAIEVLRPDGVDVASGVEAEPGRKDPKRLRAFVEAARAAL